MTYKLELKSCHDVVDTVDVANVESIFYSRPIGPDILTVVMKNGKRLYCDEVCPINSLQEEPATSVWHDKSEKPKMNSIIVMNNNQTTLSVEYVGQSLCGVERWAYIDNLLKL